MSCRFLKTVESGEMDYIALMVVTAGQGVMATAHQLKRMGNSLKVMPCNRLL